MMNFEYLMSNVTSSFRIGHSVFDIDVYVLYLPPWIVS